MGVVDVDMSYNCKLEDQHFDAVSDCCGSEQYPDVDGMCSGCHEFTGWVCSVCDEEMDDEVYS